MTKKQLDRLFCETDYITSPQVARFTGLSEAATRSYAHELEVGRAGPSFIWSYDDVAALLDRLDEDDEDTDEDDEAAEGDGESDDAEEDGGDEDEDEDERYND